MKNIFAPCSLGSLRLKNRIIRAATHEGMGRADGMPTDGLSRTYEKLAAGGAGAIITGYVGVKQNGRTFANMRMFDGEQYVDVYRAMNERLKPLGTPVILQLAHGGTRSHASLSGQEVVGPSFRQRNEYGDVCREADEEEIRSIIRAFVRAIVNAQKASFDGVELHAAHGYLLSEFISPVLNKRRDDWGGPLANRMRIVREILLQAREEVGDFPLLVKISARDEDPRGITVHDAVEMVRILKESSCDAVEVSCGYGDFFNTVRMTGLPVDAILHFAPGYRDLPALRKRMMKLGTFFSGKGRKPLHNYNVDMAERIKKEVDIPIIAVGGIRNLQDINNIITERNIDFVSLSRPFIIEPDIVERFRTGSQERSRCIDCGYCLIGVTSGPLRCYYGRVPRT